MYKVSRLKCNSGHGSTVSMNIKLNIMLNFTNGSCKQYLQYAVHWVNNRRKWRWSKGGVLELPKPTANN